MNSFDLSFSYPRGPSFLFPDIDLRAKEVLLILGHSGVGKTTLLHILAGLRKPTSGTVNINGTNLIELSGSKADNFRGKNIGIIHQQSVFIRSINVLQNLLLAQTLVEISADESAALKLLSDLKIGHRASALPKELSVGERQRASIARALITQPKIVLADEPTSALDDENCERVANLLEETVLGSGASLIIVTHDHRLKNRFANRIEL